jgi:hypothetical protein
LFIDNAEKLVDRLVTTMATISTKTSIVGSHRPRKESRVQVGVRIRPLTSQEIQHGGKSSLGVDSPSIRMGQRRFTYDAVFEDTCGQKTLYDRVAGPLLSSFVDGYNATVGHVSLFLMMALGQCLC